MIVFDVIRNLLKLCISNKDIEEINNYIIIYVSVKIFMCGRIIYY